MLLEINETCLPVYEALASSVRLHIIQLLSKNKMNIKELAAEIGLSSAILTKHVQKLEQANIVKTEKIGQQKIVSLRVDQITIDFPKKIYNAFDTLETFIPIGHYTDFQVQATCGLATSTHFIGKVDEPRFFMDPDRMDAQILWFTQGFVEYQSPNYLPADSKLEMLEISMEISSEFPFANNNWPSDISFYLNQHLLGTWTSPGDFADIRGKLTPDWYPDNLNQYGLLKTIRILEHGTYMEGEPLSDFSISDLDATDIMWKLRIEVPASAKHIGGCTLFGKEFGNYDQDIKIKTYYS